jgi:hypothetical protein
LTLATVLRNFAAYAAALAGYTAAIIAADQLGATGGPNGDAFMLAIFRSSEICIGIVCAGIRDRFWRRPPAPFHLRFSRRHRSTQLKFIEIDLLGVYVAPISLLIIAAWFVTIALRRIADRFGLLGYVWHPSVFVFAVYIIVLSSMVLAIAR